MPTSGGIFDNRIELLLKKYQFKSYLDIGPGEGKYGKMIKNLYPKAHITGVEPYEGYHKFLGRDDVPMTMDHIIPLSKGGLHTKENMATACMSCNSGKKDKSKEEYERIKKSFQPS